MNNTSTTATDPVYVSFVPRDAQVQLGSTNEDKRERSVSMHVVLDSDEDVRLPDNRTLKQARWGIYLSEANTYNDWATERGAIGVVSASHESANSNAPLPEECFIGAALSPEQFSTLLAVLQGGRLPSKVRIRVVGMKYGQEGIVWDRKATPTAPLIELKFDIPLITPIHVSSEFGGDPANAGSLPVTANDIRLLERRVLDHLESAQRELSKRWIILFVLLAVAVILLYSHR